MHLQRLASTRAPIPSDISGMKPTSSSFSAYWLGWILSQTHHKHQQLASFTLLELKEDLKKLSLGLDDPIVAVSQEREYPSEVTKAFQDAAVGLRVMVRMMPELNIPALLA